MLLQRNNNGTVYGYFHKIMKINTGREAVDTVGRRGSRLAEDLAVTLDLWKEREGEKCTRPRVYVRSIDFPRNYPRRNASRCVAHTHSRLRISRGRGLEKQKRGGGGGGGTRGYAHDAETTRRIVAQVECVLCARAPFPVFGSHVVAAPSTVKRRDTCRTNSEIFATPCTRRYLRAAPAARIINACA